MRIKIWGCRGSIPSPGADTSRYGGNTTCVEVRLADGSLVIIDAGSGIRNLGRQLVRQKDPQRIHLLLTHAHWDHLQGFPFFLPAYREAFTIQVWGGPRPAGELRGFLRRQLEPPYFPVKFTSLPAGFRFTRQADSGLKLGDTRIEAIPLTHPNGGFGFRFSEGGRTFVYLTDNELGYDHPGGLSAAKYAELCGGADLLLHDAQYTEKEYRSTRGWGHSTFTAAEELGRAAQVRRFGLIHHDPQHTDLELDRILARRRVECFGVTEGMEIQV
jgi:phosphoribosyl 1,2-cyclic phosphodiesterase